MAILYILEQWVEDWHDMNDEDLEGTLWPILPEERVYGHDRLRGV